MMRVRLEWNGGNWDSSSDQDRNKCTDGIYKIVTITGTPRDFSETGLIPAHDVSSWSQSQTLLKIATADNSYTHC